MSQVLHGAYLILKRIIHCLFKIKSEFSVLYFNLQLATLKLNHCIIC